MWQALGVAGSDDAPARSSDPGRLRAVRERAVGLAGRIPLALAVVVALGVVLRAALWLAYDPTIANAEDTAVYLSMAQIELFSDAFRTAGYSMFLRLMHAISTDVDVTIAVQHLIGIATGLLVYATVRRTGAPVWAGVAAAAAVLLAVDQVQLEHTILSEVLFTFTVVAALYAAVRALDDPRALAGPVTSRHLWLVGAGALLGLSAWMRSLSAPLVPLVALFFVLAIPGPLWTRIGRGALAGGAGAAILVVYFALNSSTTGTFGLTQATGWAIYSRTAPFADCSQFTPPEGTEKLCEGTPKDTRPGPDHYSWSEGSPAQRVFGFPPAGDDKVGDYGVQAMLNQPRDYVTVVARDTLRYFFPGINNEQLFGGADYEYMDIHRRNRRIEADIEQRLGGYFAPESLSIDKQMLDTLSDLQQVLRLHPTLMFQAAVLAALGIWLGAGRVRTTLVLLLGATLVLLVVPSALATYNARYAIPIGGPLAAAGAIGLWVCLARLGGSRPAPRDA